MTAKHFIAMIREFESYGASCEQAEGLVAKYILKTIAGEHKFGAQVRASLKADRWGTIATAFQTALATADKRCSGTGDGHAAGTPTPGG